MNPDRSFLSRMQRLLRLVGGAGAVDNVSAALERRLLLAQEVELRLARLPVSDTPQRRAA
jgi:hypothetical protein